MKSLPKITAQTVAEYGVKVYHVEMYALMTNYFTFYLALFLAGDEQFVRGPIWSNIVGCLLIIGNVSFIIYYCYEYKSTFVKKVKQEKRNLKLIMHALRGRAVNGWKYLKRDKPPVNSTMSILVDASVVESINTAERIHSLKKISSLKKINSKKINSIRNSMRNPLGSSSSKRGEERSFEDNDEGGENENDEIDELNFMIGERILPDGWEEYMDASSGFFFWVNEETGESTWEPPEGMIGDDPNPIVVEQERQSQIDSNPMHRRGMI
jgi:hypothetical protein